MNHSGMSGLLMLKLYNNVAERQTDMIIPITKLSRANAK